MAAVSSSIAATLEGTIKELIDIRLMDKRNTLVLGWLAGNSVVDTAGSPS